MGQFALKKVPVEVRPEIRLVPPPDELPLQELPDLTRFVAANDNVEVVEGFASKFLRWVPHAATDACFYLQFLDFEGDSSPRPMPVPHFDKPPSTFTITHWLSEIQKLSDLMQLMAEKRSKIALYDMYGLTSLARETQKELDDLHTQMITAGNAYPVMGNRLEIKASAKGSDTTFSMPGEKDDANDRVRTPALTTVRESLTPAEIGDLIERLQDDVASVADIVTIFTSGAAQFMEFNRTVLSDIAQETPNNIVIDTLRNPLMPVDVRVIQMLFLIHIQDDRARSALSQAIQAAGDDLDAYAAGVRDVYRNVVTGADQILAAVDDYLQGQQQRLRVTILRPTNELIGAIEKSRAVDVSSSLSLLLHGEEAMQWFKLKMRTGTGKYGRGLSVEAQAFLDKQQRALNNVLGTFGLSREQQGMVVDLLCTHPILAIDIDKYVVPFLRSDPALADLNLHRLYIANKPMGEYILAEYDRRNNLPEVRAKRAFDSALADNGHEKTWKKAMFPLQQNGGQAVLVDAIQRALRHADDDDAQELRALAGQWIDIALRDAKGTVQQLRGSTADQDPDGAHVFSFFNARSYDPATQPLGFLLPHEQRFWDQRLSDSHPTLQLLHQIERVHPDNFRVEYAALTDPEWFAEGNAVVRRAATSEVGDVDAAAVRELMRRAVVDPQLHVALLYWGASEPKPGATHDAWSRVPARVAEVLDFARSRRAHVAGNILELVLRSENYDGVAELHAVQRYSRERGNWVQILPDDYAHRRQVADLLVIGRGGEQTMVEVKNHLYRGRQDLTGVNGVVQSLEKAASQLDSTSQEYTQTKCVIYLRLAIPHDSRLPEEVKSWIESHLRDDPRFQNVAEVVVETANAYDRTDQKTDVIENPNHPTTVSGNGSSRLAGPGEALLLSDRLVEIGLVRPEDRDIVLSRIALAPKLDVDHVLGMPPNRWRIQEALDRYSLMPIVKPYLTTRPIRP